MLLRVLGVAFARSDANVCQQRIASTQWATWSAVLTCDAGFVLCRLCGVEGWFTKKFFIFDTRLYTRLGRSWKFSKTTLLYKLNDLWNIKQDLFFCSTHAFDWNNAIFCCHAEIGRDNETSSPKIWAKKVCQKWYTVAQNVYATPSSFTRGCGKMPTCHVGQKAFMHRLKRYLQAIITQPRQSIRIAFSGARFESCDVTIFTGWLFYLSFKNDLF